MANQPRIVEIDHINAIAPGGFLKVNAAEEIGAIERRHAVRKVIRVAGLTVLLVGLVVGVWAMLRLIFNIKISKSSESDAQRRTSLAADEGVLPNPRNPDNSPLATPFMPGSQDLKLNLAPNSMASVPVTPVMATVDVAADHPARVCESVFRTGYHKLVNKSTINDEQYSITARKCHDYLRSIVVSSDAPSTM